MALTALLFAHHGARPDGEPPAMRIVAGLSVIERQVRQVRRFGIDRVIVAVERMPSALASTLAGLDVEVVRAAEGLRVDADERLLVIEDALVVDPRIIAAVVAKDQNAVAVWRGRNGPERSQRIDPASHWAGVAIYQGALVLKVIAGLGDWDLQETLLRAAFAEEKPPRVDAGAIDLYDPAGRRTIPLIWVPVRSDADAVRAAEATLAAAQAGCPDWPSRYLYAHIGDALVRAALGASVKTSVMGVAGLTCGIAAAVAFATGWLWSGLVLALASAPLLETRRKLARVRHERWDAGGLKVARAALEGSWYVALATHFSLAQEGALASWAIALLIMLGSWGRSVHGAMFERFTARPLDDTGDFERRLRLFGSGRDANFWMLLPFGALGAWFAGFVAVALYVVATYAVTQMRFFSRLAAYVRVQSPRMAANLAAADDRRISIFKRWLSSK